MPRSLPLLLLVTACELPSLGGGKDGEPKPYVITEKDLTIDEGDLGTLELEIDEGMNGFLITAYGTNFLSVDEVINPDGDSVFYWEDWYNEPTWLTSAIYPIATDCPFQWPIRPEDGPGDDEQLDEGTWTIYLGSYNRFGSPKADEVTVQIHRKRDEDLDEGRIGVRIVYADGVDDDEDVVAAVEASAERWREIWAEYDLVLDEEYDSSDIDPDLSSPSDRTDELETLSEETDGRQITVVIGETIDSSELYYGVTGNIPGSLSPSPRAGIVISWIANSGGDGKFSDDDIRLFGETLAHEVGHYMGLFHPVEMTWDSWDALDDTQKCSSQSKCEDGLGDNLMFPYPVCSWTSCVAQDQMSDTQVGVIQRYTGTE